MTKLSFILANTGFRIDDAFIPDDPDISAWQDRFTERPYETLYSLAYQERPDFFDAAGTYLCRLAERFAEDLSHTPGIEISRDNTVVDVPDSSYDLLLDSVPFVLGSEHVTKKWIDIQYDALTEVFCGEIAEYDGTVALYFEEKSRSLHIPERIFFHLVEQEDDPEYPFAFIATYATKTDSGRVRHMPLQYALTEYGDDRSKLLELLACLNKASEVSGLIAEFTESGELFHPLRLTADEAYRLLKDIPALESIGIMCRIPNWWRKRYNVFAVSVKLGEEQPSLLGLDSVLSMVPELTVGGVPLTEAEIRDLLTQTDGLLMLKGRWIEVNHDRLRQMLDIMEEQKDSMKLLDALRMGISEKIYSDKDADVGLIVTNGKWLGGLLKSLRDPQKLGRCAVPDSFSGTLRPYQDNGYNWLLQMNSLHFGACLADDMGLGKTVQILAFLEKLRTDDPDAKALLIVPASLLGNWRKEAERFVPEMTVEILHGMNGKFLAERFEQSDAFLTVTTYRMAMSIPALSERVWDCVILDEAQAIKNPVTKQTKHIKTLQSNMRIAMTGTPIENDLTNLWSLFDFLDKGLLGASDEFRRYCRDLDENPEGYAKLKGMISPFLLRRVKTDKSIISDLPDKLEQNDYIELSKKQTVLYRKLLAETEMKILNSDGMQRRGIILALLLKLKQICNHPDQFLGLQEYAPAQSGKFEMLRQLAETIYEKRERVLVFTQFREITGFLDDYLAGIFGKRGGVIHGGVPVKEREHIVERFQSDSYVPYMVLSVRAGGTGLNLTKANHVIHFDRWWNPSVENQATDRAFRIGQQKNVMVHKFVCRDSVEEKIDRLINSKKELAENVIGSGGENWITELGNDELMSIFRLD